MEEGRVKLKNAIFRDINFQDSGECNKMGTNFGYSRQPPATVTRIAQAERDALEQPGDPLDLEAQLGDSDTTFGKGLPPSGADVPTKKPYAPKPQ
jgi:hypothetical protein